MEKFKLYAGLFLASLYISSFTFGGGYVVIPMIRDFYVRKKKLFTEEELMDMAAIAQSSPGAIAVNLTVMAGNRAGGMAGALLCFIGALLPSVIILSVIARAYDVFRSQAYIAAALKGMEAGAAALIAELTLDMGTSVAKKGDRFQLLLMGAVFVAVYFLEIHAAAVLICCAVITIVKGRWRKADA